MKQQNLIKKITFLSFFIFLSFVYVFSNAHAMTLAQKLAGRILLQVESKGEAWYVDPVSLKRIYLSDGDSAYGLMRSKGLGIKNADLQKIPIALTPEPTVQAIPGWETYQDDTLGLRMQYPKGWFMPFGVEQTNGLISLQMNHDLNLPEQFNDGVELIFIYRYSNVTADLESWYQEKSTFNEANIQSRVESGNKPSLEYTTEREEFSFERSIPMNISKISAISEYQSGPYAYNTATRLKTILTEKNYYVKVGDDIYYITAESFSGEDKNKVMQRFDAIINTLQFQPNDSDHDGLSDELEGSLKTDSHQADSDNDGHDDGVEVLNGYNPLGAGRISKDQSLINRMKGKILLQVESRGEAWYVNPVDGKRYYLKDGVVAYQIMRVLALGISNKDLNTIEASPEPQVYVIAPKSPMTSPTGDIKNVVTTLEEITKFIEKNDTTYLPSIPCFSHDFNTAGGIDNNQKVYFTCFDFPGGYTAWELIQDNSWSSTLTSSYTFQDKKGTREVGVARILNEDHLSIRELYGKELANVSGTELNFQPVTPQSPEIMEEIILSLHDTQDNLNGFQRIFVLKNDPDSIHVIFADFTGDDDKGLKNIINSASYVYVGKIDLEPYFSQERWKVIDANKVKGEAKARDSKRIVDVKQIQTALELYYSDIYSYPAGTNLVLGIDAQCLDFLLGFNRATCSGTSYQYQIPANPGPNGSHYTYTRISDHQYNIDFTIEEDYNSSLKKGELCATEEGINQGRCRSDRATQPIAKPSTILPEVTASDYIRGDKNAPITLIEYSDFECPFCLRHTPTIDKALVEYAGKVRLVYRHFPLSFHPQAQKAAEAFECAGEQGKPYEMHDKIFNANEHGTMSVTKWKEIAKDLNLNTAQFDSCLDTGKYAVKVSQQASGGVAAGVNGTPTTFVNGHIISGAVSYEQFKQTIDSLLIKSSSTIN